MERRSAKEVALREVERGKGGEIRLERRVVRRD